MVKKKKIAKKTKAPSSEIPVVDLTVEARDRYYRYGVKTNEDRAIPCGITGLKPVAQRGLWATHVEGGHSKAKFSKAALYVGITIGHYHPHGSTAAYGALVTLANTFYPMIEGEGNWGSFSDKTFAAERYTEMRLSLYSDNVFFDKFYLPTLQMVPNYDDARVEPLHLVALLPNMLINGNVGIGTGVSVDTPSFTVDSISKVIIKALTSKSEITYKDCMKLDFTVQYGGEAIENKAEKKRLLETGKGRIQFRSIYEIVDKHTIHFTKFAEFNLPKALDKVAGLKDVISVNDISDVVDKYGKIEVHLRKTLSSNEVAKIAERLAVTEFGSTSPFDISVTDRFINERGQGDAKLRRASVVRLLNDWIAYRVQLEKDACTYWIAQCDKEVARLELMILAVKFRDVIIKLLSDKKLDDETLAVKIAKALKITVDQANFILDLKIRALKALEEAKLKSKVKELKDEISGYKLRIKKPREYIAKHVADLTKKISAHYS